MVIDRRSFLAGGIAAGAVPLSSAPLVAEEATSILACGREGTTFICAGLTTTGRISFSVPLPGRGHGIAVAPDRRSAIVLARRPGRFAALIDLRRRHVSRVFRTREDRHFCGHGVFSRDGRYLYATENDFDGERGVIGVYAANEGFRRIGEMDSGGIGPHEVLLLRDGRTLAVANGGILTHPDFGRRKLNLSTMAPNLALIDVGNGDNTYVAVLPDELRQVSIRHVTEALDGTVWWGGQYEGPETDCVPLVGSMTVRDQSLTPLAFEKSESSAFKQYVGSIVASRARPECVATSPRGGIAAFWNLETGGSRRTLPIEDGCGVADTSSGFILSSGNGEVVNEGLKTSRRHVIEWDNHMTSW